MLNVRELKKEDKERIKYIVVKTASNDYKDKPEATKLLFCDYYVDYGNGYVLEDDGLVVGYILCSEDYKEYVKTFRDVYMPKLKEVDKAEYRKKKLEMLMDKLMGKKYPAHLHIDILEEYCEKGYGKSLNAKSSR